MPVIKVEIYACAYVYVLETISAGADPGQNLTGFKGVPKKF